MSEHPARKALLTGATGFIGGHLARTLLKEGWDLHVIVRSDFGLTTLEDILPQLHIHTHDGSTGQLLQIVADCSPDVVFHLASLFIAQHTPSDISQLVQSNVTFATQLTEAMVQNNSWCLINTGTSWEHYENASYNPVNLYAATKQAFQNILAYYLATTPLKAITLKLFDSYGPGDPRPKLFSLLQKVAEAGKPLAMSQGEQLIDLVYIDDIVRAYLMAANCLLAGEVVGHEQYAVSSGRPLKLRELVELYSTVTGKKLSIQWGARQYRQREVMVPWQNGTTLAGWKPQIDLIEGIRRIETARDTT